MIEGGYFKMARKIIESEIFQKPPLYLKVWVYLLAKAQHKPVRGLECGEFFTSAEEICEACTWYVGFRKERPTRKQIHHILGYFRGVCEVVTNGCLNEPTNGTPNEPMIETTRVKNGMKIKVVKFDDYQDVQTYVSGNSVANGTHSCTERDSEPSYDGCDEYAHACAPASSATGDNLQYKEGRKKYIPPIVPRGDDVFSDYAGEDAELFSVLKDFEAMRKQQKKPMTERAQKKLLTELDKLSAGDRTTKLELLNQSILHCWLSVYPLKETPEPPASQYKFRN